MSHNVGLNGLSRPGKPYSGIESKVLDWEQPLPSWVGGEAGQDWPDVIM
jgi:hypothetical protein